MSENRTSADPNPSAPTPPRKRADRPQAVLEVIRTERMTPHLHRLVLGGEGFAALHRNTATDAYVKLLLPAHGSGLQPPFDLETLRAQSPELLPLKRTYTVRRWDDEQGTITIDVVVHDEDGTDGVAAPWAIAARPGDRIAMHGAGGKYAPEPEQPFHLLIGDLSAQPAIAAALEAMPADARGLALIQVEDPRDVPETAHPDGLPLHWLVGDRDQLLTEVAALDLPTPEDIQAFVHGERGIIKQLRGELVKRRGIPKAQISVSAYWALGRIEDQFQAEKREPIGNIED